MGATNSNLVHLIKEAVTIVQVSDGQVSGRGCGDEERGGHVQDMAGPKVHWVDLMGGWTGWRKESEEDEVRLR